MVQIILVDVDLNKDIHVRHAIDGGGGLQGYKKIESLTKIFLHLIISAI